MFQTTILAPKVSCHVCFMKIVNITFECPHPSAHEAYFRLFAHLFLKFQCHEQMQQNYN
jgi:hypothetical protein